MFQILQPQTQVIKLYNHHPNKNMSPKLLNILLIVSSYVLYFYIAVPIYTGAVSILLTPGENNIKSLIEKKEKYVLANESIETLITEAKSIQGKYDAFDQATKDKIMIMIPESIDNIKLLSELTRIANENGITLDSLSVKEKGGGEYAVNLTMMATYSQFKEFITYYENSMRLLALQSVNFSPSKNETDEYKFSVEFLTYYLK